MYSLFSSNLKKWLPLAFAGAAALSLSSTAFASEEHSDVEFLFTGGAIEIEWPLEDGSPIFVFESDFNEGLTPGLIDDPGFNNDEFLGTSDLPMPGSILSFNVLGPLVYWNGSSFADPGSASIEITDVLTGVSTIDGSTISDLASFTPGSLENSIGQANAIGEIHQHIDFQLFNGATGAYGLTMSLTTDEAGIADSRTFGIFFNNFLSEEDFEAGVEAYNATIVPVPAGVWLFATALGFLIPRFKQKTV